jgi:hypothetical protein
MGHRLVSVARIYRLPRVYTDLYVDIIDLRATCELCSRILSPIWGPLHALIALSIVRMATWANR